MSAREPSGRIDDLLRHQEWLRRLARALVRDERLADDLVQDTWMAALEKPPTIAGAERSWLRRVLVRRLARLRSRDAARVERESAHPPRPRPDAADDVVARAEMQQRVAHAVFALDEPYRKTVLLHYFEGLPPREIATLMSVPVETVRTRLKRARNRLRDQLDASDGPDAWRALLLPLVGLPRPAPAPPSASTTSLGSTALSLAGGTVMGTMGKTIAGAAAVALLAAALWSVTDEREPAPAPRTVAASSVDTSSARETSREKPRELAPLDEPTDDPLAGGGPLVRVRVLDTAGRPVAGARVEAFNRNGEVVDGDWLAFLGGLADPPQPISSGRTAADGSLRIASGTGRRRTLRVSAPGSAVHGTVLDRVPDGAPVEITVRPGHTLSGTVRRPDGSPVAGALVTGWPGGFSWSEALGNLRVTARTDTVGRYRLDGLPAGPVQIFVAADGGPITEQHTLLVPDIDRHDIRLATHGVLEGRVLDAESGDPVPDCDLVLGGPSEGRWFSPFRVRSDADGRYRATVLPDMEIRTRHTRVLNSDRVTVEDPRGELTVSGRGVTRYDVRTRPGATLRGVVRGPDGPVEGAIASAHFGHGGTIVYRSARTDAAGRFEIVGLPQVEAMVEVRATDWVQVGIPDNPGGAAARDDYPEGLHLDIPASGTVSFEGRMVRARRVAGRVLDDVDGTPVAGARVSMGDGIWLRITSTDADGRFELRGMPPDREFPVEVKSGMHVPASVPSTDASEIRLARSVWLRGRVRIRGGTPRPGTMIEVRTVDGAGDGRRRPIEPDGTFLVPVRGPAGTYLVRAVTRGGAEATTDPVDVTAMRRDDAAAPVEIDIRDVADLRMRVLVAESDEPVEGALVLRGPLDEKARENKWRRPVFVARSGDDGRAIVHHVAPGRHWVRVDLPGRVSFEGALDASTAGEHVVRLARVPEVRGRVTRADGSPAAHAYVVAKRGRDVVDRTYALVDGTFVLRPGDGDPCDIQAWPGAGSSLAPARETGVRVGASEIELRLPESRSIAGRVTDADGEPLAGLPVVLRANDRELGERRTDDAGRFEFDAAPTAPVTVHLDANDARRLAEPVRVSGSGAQTVHLVATHGAAITGRVVGRDGSPLAGARVSFTAHAALDRGDTGFGEFATATTGSDGSFRADGLHNGRYAAQLRHLADGNAESLALHGGADLAAGGSPVDLIVDEGVSLRGHVVPPSPGDVSGWVRVHALTPGGTSRGASIQPDGTFTLRALLPDTRYRLEFEVSGWASMQIEVVTDGRPLPGLHLPTAPVTTAQIVDGEGLPVPDRLFIVRGEGRTSRGTTDQQGRFTVRGLPAGTYDVQVAIPFGAFDSKAWTYRKMGTIRSGDADTRITFVDPNAKKKAK